MVFNLFCRCKLCRFPFTLFTSLSFFCLMTWIYFWFIFGFHYEFCSFFLKHHMHFHFQRNNPYSIFTKHCHSMSIKKNQTFLCSIKILQAFTNKLLYQTLNIYKKKYLHFSPLAIVKIFKIIFLVCFIVCIPKSSPKYKFWKKMRGKKKPIYPPYKLIHPKNK